MLNENKKSCVTSQIPLKEEKRKQPLECQRAEKNAQIRAIIASQEKRNFTVGNGTHEMNMANVIQSFHDSFACIKCGPEYILKYVLAVISCGTDHQLQSAMIINTVHQVHSAKTYK